MPERFWMVFVENGAAPNYKHTTAEAAHAEAERLAKLASKRAYVLAAVWSCEVRAVEWTRLAVVEDIPF